MALLVAAWIIINNCNLSYVSAKTSNSTVLNIYFKCCNLVYKLSCKTGDNTIYRCVLGEGLCSYKHAAVS